MASAAAAAAAAIRGKNFDDKMHIIKLEPDNPLSRAFHDRPEAGDRCSVAAEAEPRETSKLRQCFLTGVLSDELLKHVPAETGPVSKVPSAFDRETRVGSATHTARSLHADDNLDPDKRSDDHCMCRLLQVFARTSAWASYGDGLEAYLARVGRFSLVEPTDSTHLTKVLADVLDRILQADLSLVSPDRLVKRPTSMPPLPPLPDDHYYELNSRSDPSELLSDSVRLNSEQYCRVRSPGFLPPTTRQVADHVVDRSHREQRAHSPLRPSVDLVVNTMLRWRLRHEAAKVVGGELSLQQLLERRLESRTTSPPIRTPAKRFLGVGDKAVLASSGEDDDDLENVAADDNDLKNGAADPCRDDVDSSWVELLRKEHAFKVAAAHTCCPGAMPSPLNPSYSDDRKSRLPRLGPCKDSLSAKSLRKLTPRLGFICSTLSNDSITNSLYESLRDLISTKDDQSASFFEALETIEVPHGPSPRTCSIHLPPNFLDTELQVLDDFEGTAPEVRSSLTDSGSFSPTEFSPFSKSSLDDDDAMLLHNLLMSPVGLASSPWITLAQKFDVDEPVDEVESRRRSQGDDLKPSSRKMLCIQLHGRTVKVKLKVAKHKPKSSRAGPKPRRVTVVDDRENGSNIGKTPHNAKFPGSLLDILTTKKYEHIVAWDDSFSGIVVKDGHLFATEIAPCYFSSNASGDGPLKLFYRQLCYYGFIRIKDAHVWQKLKVKPVAGARYFVNRDTSITSVKDVSRALRYTPRSQGNPKTKQRKKRRL